MGTHKVWHNVSGSLTLTLTSGFSFRKIMYEAYLSYYLRQDFSDSFTILGLWVLGLAVSHINGSNCKLNYESRALFFMTSLQYHIATWDLLK